MISREEINNIAEAVAERVIAETVAERVISKAKPCRCGVAMWGSRIDAESLETIIRCEKAEWLGDMPPLILHTLTGVEEKCSVDLSEAKHSLKGVETAIKREDWTGAKAELDSFKSAVLAPVQKCAMESGSPSNPGYEQPPITPMPKEIRANLRQIPTWRLKEAYDKLQTGEATSIEVVEQDRALAQAAIREILWERGELPSVLRR